MKFFSKYSNFRIVLKHGLPGEPMTGRAAVPGVYVKFEDGQVDVKSEEVIKMLLAHPTFGNKFVAEDADPFKGARKSTEPEHDMVNVEYGHIGSNKNPKQKIDQKKAVIEMAKEIAIPLAKEMAKNIIAEMQNAEPDSKAPETEVEIEEDVDTTPEKAPKVEPVLSETKSKK